MNFGFIIGTGRCGTTLLAKMLNAHSEICVPHELQILFEEGGNGKRLREVFESGDHARYEAEDYIKLIQERCPYRFQEYFDYGGFFRKRVYPESSFDKLATDLFTEVAQSRGKSYFIEQTPWYGQHLASLNGLFPRAKYIHVIRDGRDVAISFARTPWWSNDILENLCQWERESSAILNHSLKILKPDQVLIVRYEDLVEDPEKTLMDVCGFLGVKFEPALLDSANYIRYESFLKENLGEISSTALRQWESGSKKPTFTESVYSWKNHEGVDFRKAGDKVEKLLASLGYEPSPQNSLMKHTRRIPSFVTSLKNRVQLFFTSSPPAKASPLTDGSHARTDPFFDSLVRRGYMPRHIVDVGANRGNWTRTATKYFPDAHYSMFEPQEKMREEVRDLLRHPNVEFHCIGAGPVNSTMRLTQHERDDSHTFALSEQQAQDFGFSQVEIPVVSLDEFFAKRSLPKVDILKIDAEGWDLEVLKGAIKTAAQADIVLLEASVLNPVFTNTVEEVICAMSQLGMVLFDITDLNRTEKHGALWLVELAFVKKGGDLRKGIKSYS